MGDNIVSKSEEINFVAKDRFWKTAYDSEMKIQFHTWPNMWGDIVIPEYRKMNETLDKGEMLPLPHKTSAVKDHVRPFVPKPENVRPFPATSSKEYGWKYGNSPVCGAEAWEKRHAHTYMHKDLKWPEDHQW